MHDEASAKKLTIAPAERIGAMNGTPYIWESTFNGASILSSVVEYPAVPITST